MHDTTAFGRALSPAELSHARYLDAITAFRTRTGLCMTQGAPEGGGDGGDGGQGGDGGGAGGNGGAGPANATDEQGRDLGYPKDTPVNQMTEEQRAAYGRHKDEQRKAATRAWKNVTGERTPEQLKADLDELERLRDQSRTDSERAVAEAKRQAEAELTAKFGTKLVAAEFRAALASVEDTDERDALIDMVALEKYVTETGDVDTAKVQADAKRLVKNASSGSTDDLTRRRRDFAGGQRPEGLAARGAAGRAEAERRGFIKPAGNQTTTS